MFVKNMFTFVTKSVIRVNKQLFKLLVEKK